MATLTLFASPPQSYSLTKPMITIGQDPSNDLVLKDPELLGSHAIIHCDGTSFFVQGADRKAQVFVNGKHRKRQELSDQDVIQIGDTKMRFDIFVDGQIGGGGTSPEAEDSLRLDGFQQLTELSVKLLGNYNIGDLLNELMDAVVSLTEADKGFIVLLDEDNPENLRIVAARNIHQESVSRPEEIISDSIVHKVLESKQAIIVSDALEDVNFAQSQSVINLKLCSVMCVPLMVNGKLLGLIYVGNDRIANLFDTSHLTVLSAFVAQASLILSNAMLVEQLTYDNERLLKKLEGQRFGEIIGSCDQMKQVYRTIEKVAPTDVGVLVIGETGTGKELIAHEIHRCSQRHAGPFVTINCGAIPENLLESELFGHLKGSFTGATTTREGKFQAANQGTVFLDEIGEMPLALQVKMLRVLQERRVTKVGSTTPEDLDIRIIAATNQNLEEMTEDGRFRHDLYYRLNVVTLDLPPLRERGNDTILIAKYLMETIAKDLQLPHKKMTQAALTGIMLYDWPGNIRQLENRIRKALVLSDGDEVTAEDLGFMEDSETTFPSLSEAKERFALSYILESLERHGGNRARTAEALQVDPRTIYRYLGKDL